MDAGVRRVPPFDRFFRYHVPRTPREVDRLDVEAEPAFRHVREEPPRAVAAKELEAALRVAVAKAEKCAREEVEGLAHPLAVERLADRDARAVERARAKDDVGA